MLLDLSLIGSCFIILCYIKYKEIKKLSFELILYLSISDLIRSSSNILFGSPKNNASLLCQLQGIMSTFGGLASFLWVFVISMVMYGIIFYPKQFNKESILRQKKIYHIVIWPFAFGLSLLPLITYPTGYKNTGARCWISHDTWSQILFSWICFYGWLWVIFIVILVQYCRLWVYIRLSTKNAYNKYIDNDNTTTYNNNSTKIIESLPNNTNTNAITDSNFTIKQDPVKLKIQNTTKRMKYYPLILVFCYFWATVRRIWYFTDNDAPFIIVCFRIFFAAIYGFVNALVYGINVYNIIKASNNMKLKHEMEIGDDYLDEPSIQFSSDKRYNSFESSQ